jgi:hypothetical protein
VGQQREDGVGRPHQDQVVPHPRREEAETLRGGLGRQLLCGQIYLAEERDFLHIFIIFITKNTCTILSCRKERADERILGHVFIKYLSIRLRKKREGDGYLT